MKKILILSMILSLVACAPKEETPSPPTSLTCPYVSGQVNTNVGSSLGSNYSFSTGVGVIHYANTNNTLWMDFGNVIVNVGNLCIIDADFWTGDNSSGVISAIVGTTYVVRTRTVINGVITYYYSRFVINSYRNGIINVTYVQH
jgi:hypothetical protein